MDLKNYEILEQFAEGGFGEIYYVKHGKEIYALKQIKYRGKLENDPYILGEIRSLMELKHEHIIGLHDVIITSHEVNIIMECAQGGNLEEYVQINGILLEGEIRGLFYQILLGVDHCHSNGIAHRDLTPSNILLTGRGVIKLADFGLAVKARDKKGHVILCQDYLGNNSYLSPEILRKELFDPILSDIWSLGITLYFLISGHEPYTGTMEDVRDQQENKTIFPILNGDKNTSDSLESIVRCILQRIPNDRPTVNSVILDISDKKPCRNDSDVKSIPIESKLDEAEFFDEIFFRQV